MVDQGHPTCSSDAVSVSFFTLKKITYNHKYVYRDSPNPEDLSQLASNPPLTCIRSDKWRVLHKTYECLCKYSSIHKSSLVQQCFAGQFSSGKTVVLNVPTTKAFMDQFIQWHSQVPSLASTGFGIFANSYSWLKNLNFVCHFAHLRMATVNTHQLMQLDNHLAIGFWHLGK